MQFFVGILLLAPFIGSAQEQITENTVLKGIDSTETRVFQILDEQGKKAEELNINFKSVDGDNVEVKGHIIDGDVVVEGDIILGKAEEMEIRNKGVIIGEIRTRTTGWWFWQRTYTTDYGKKYRWSGGRIPYYLPSSHPKKSKILDAIRKINRETVLTLVPRRKEKDYVSFRWSGQNGGANSYVGKIGGGQTINIPGWASRGTIIHEIFHAAGMYHEQSRCDRDNHVKIIYSNIKSGYAGNFSKKCSNASDTGGYNHRSIMHYGPYAFSKNGKPTIVVKNWFEGLFVGQRSYISDGDKYALDLIY